MAERIGTSEVQTYEVEGGLVIWKFHSIERVYPVLDDELRNGTEVFSRFLRDSEVRSLLTPFDEQ